MKPRYERALTLEELAALPDEDIDYSDIPELDAEWFRTAKVVFPPGKEQVTVRIDSDVLAWFRARGKGYQSRMNSVLRAYVMRRK